MYYIWLMTASGTKKHITLASEEVRNVEGTTSSYKPPRLWLRSHSCLCGLTILDRTLIDFSMLFPKELDEKEFCSRCLKGMEIKNGCNS